MGRKNFLEALDLTYDDLLMLHNDCTNIDQLADDLEVSKKTLLKHLKLRLKKDDIKFKPHKQYKKHSSFAKWRRKHPDVILPNNVPEIQQITGLSRYAIHAYLNRRLEQYHNYVRQNFSTFLKNHRDKSMLNFGYVKFPIKALQRTALTIDKFSLTMTITFQLRNAVTKRIYITETQFKRSLNDNNSNSHD